MTDSWPAEHSSVAGVVRAAVPVGDGGAADAWRRAARIVAWVGVVTGALSFASIVASQLDTRNRGIFTSLSTAFAAADWADKVIVVLQLAGVGLAGLGVLGSVGVLAGRRWGATALVVYGAAAPVVMVGYLVAFAFSRTSSPFTGGSAWVMIQYALASLPNLAFPVVAFFVMRAARPHVGRPAGGSAFEPLPHAPLPRQT